jgi:predicted alpha/beta hydrolase family esterase
MKIAIIHGTKGTPEGNWFPWLASKLENLGHEVIVPRFPTPENQSLTVWRDVFVQSFGQLTKDTILIGHSIGAMFALRLLEMSTCQIAATFLVAGLNAKIGIPEYDNLNSSFLAAPLQWDKIRNSSQIFQCLIGSNDPYVPFEQPISISQELNCSPIIIKDGGHLNSESGYSEFPLLISELTKMLK